jgi:hypothetical protein
MSGVYVVAEFSIFSLFLNGAKSIEFFGRPVPYGQYYNILFLTDNITIFGSLRTRESLASYGQNNNKHKVSISDNPDLKYQFEVNGI